MAYITTHPQSMALTVKATLPTNVPRNQSTCRLIWRQNKLWVLPAATSKSHCALPALAKPEWFKACLERSKAKAVIIDPSLGSEVITFWAEACEQIGKPLFLRLPTMGLLPEKRMTWTWRFKCALERAFGLGLLFLFSPILLLFSILLNLQDGAAPFTYYWCIGRRGQVFRMTQFRRESVKTGEITLVGQFLEISRLDRLPRLLNVVRGEMVLVGTKPWTIEDALKVPEQYRTCLKAMPGLVGPRPTGLNSLVIDVRSICVIDLSYLKAWSLWRDGRFTVLAFTRFLTVIKSPVHSRNRV
jgi:lipopolysaccharide/colanic/teichoic acid biosynthesis glycosyltransferase